MWSISEWITRLLTAVEGIKENENEPLHSVKEFYIQPHRRAYGRFCGILYVTRLITTFKSEPYYLALLHCRLFSKAQGIKSPIVTRCPPLRDRVPKFVKDRPRPFPGFSFEVDDSWGPPLQSRRVAVQSQIQSGSDSTWSIDRQDRPSICVGLSSLFQILGQSDLPVGPGLVDLHSRLGRPNFLGENQNLVRVYNIFWDFILRTCQSIPRYSRITLSAYV